MGYSEILCQICGVSFNIARLRTIEEPSTAGWNYRRGDGYVRAGWGSCGRGCKALDRRTGQIKYLPKRQGVSSNDENDDEQPYDGSQYAVVDSDLDRNWEHIAGPACVYNAYNGHYVSVEEMKGCRTFQCLVPKPAGWTSEEHDETFESTLAYYLSGLSDDATGRGLQDRARHRPRRHGEPLHRPDVYFFVEDNTDTTSMPFHPWCLEVFKRASLVRTGSIDIEGLLGWWQHDGDYEIWNSFPRADGVTAMQKQWWAHMRGAEYMAANPLFMPGLAEVLHSASALNQKRSESSVGVFNLPEDARVHPSAGDGFGALPVELHIMLLSYVDSRDLANLRLASRAFRQLPVSVFHDLVQRELPWLWEAWSNVNEVPYSCWAANRLDRTHRDFQLLGISSHEPLAVPNQLPRGKVDWFRLFCSIKQAMRSGELKGLRNRRRIWTDCQEALDRIELYRGRGEIPVKDHKALVRQWSEEYQIRIEQARQREEEAEG